MSHQPEKLGDRWFKMRKDLLGVSAVRVCAALASLGYNETRPKRKNAREFRRGKFHVIVRGRKTRTTLNIHVNSRVGFPVLGHKVRKSGGDLETELDHIVKAIFIS